MSKLDREVAEAIISTMRRGVLPMSEAKDLFEDACLTTVVTCGPPPPTPGGVWEHHSFDPNTQNLNRDAYTKRQAWITEVENLLTGRYGVPSENVGDFIVAFETWCSLHREDAGVADDEIEIETQVGLIRKIGAV